MIWVFLILGLGILLSCVVWACTRTPDQSAPAPSVSANVTSTVVPSVTESDSDLVLFFDTFTSATQVIMTDHTPEIGSRWTLRPLSDRSLYITVDSSGSWCQMVLSNYANNESQMVTAQYQPTFHTLEGTVDLMLTERRTTDCYVIFMPTNNNFYVFVNLGNSPNFDEGFMRIQDSTTHLGGSTYSNADGYPMDVPLTMRWTLSPSGLINCELYYTATGVVLQTASGQWRRNGSNLTPADYPPQFIVPQMSNLNSILTGNWAMNNLRIRALPPSKIQPLRLPAQPEKCTVLENAPVQVLTI